MRVHVCVYLCECGCVLMRSYVCVCLRMCVRACVRAVLVSVSVCVRTCVCVCP